MSRTAGLIVLIASAIVTVPAAAQSQPPIQSPQDAACRNEAANRVFTEPNPQRLDMYTIGKRIWQDCMRRADRTHRVRAKGRTRA
jgi:hypothetical protein